MSLYLSMYLSLSVSYSFFVFVFIFGEEHPKSDILNQYLSTGIQDSQFSELPHKMTIQIVGN